MYSRSRLLSVRKSICHLKQFNSDTPKPETTALYDFHVKNGGKMVNFGGFLLPVQYNNLGIAASHLHTRKSASLFDVSHMLQTEIFGSDCVQFMESLLTADLQSLPPNTSTLTVFTNENGGVLDDLIVTKITDDHLYVVSNAAMKVQDRAILEKGLERHRKHTNPNSDVRLRFFDQLERGLVAVQGPKASKVLQAVTNVDLSKLYFMTSTEAEVCGVGACRVTRCGYTGEDGFEISIPAIKIGDVCEELIKSEELELAGLGARDSLRLEAGMCLYGSDLTDATTPIEAGLGWLVAKRRRQTADFPGATPILAQIREGARVRRVGVSTAAGPPARHGAAICDRSGNEIGEVTSGCPSPTLRANVAMGYVPTEASKVGSGVQLKIRDKLYAGVVCKMPFVASNYYTRPK